MYCLAYAFMLRVPSELLPLSIDCKGLTEREEASKVHSSMQTGAGTVRIHLASRKNAQWGQSISRNCWCATSKLTCPVHTVMELCGGMDDGWAIFKGLTPCAATKTLRKHLQCIGLAKVEEVTLHAFRRGHAQDMADGGSALTEILRAGGWRSVAFAEYLQTHELETKAVLETQLEESDSE